ncbi:uncharacterized protein LOC133975561 [Platichthys flesus]|uniref:uncharacterized protein LOC133975561 n=1 Tax=Platichthys flesus TaxID=8260 RepID=UPI002DBFB003|nr:uncharacterized protein LOC133975561 [Platichthys flesus]
MSDFERSGLRVCVGGAVKLRGTSYKERSLQLKSFTARGRRKHHMKNLLSLQLSMDWALFVILQVLFQPSLSDLFTVEADRNTYESEFGRDVVMGCKFHPLPSNSDQDLKVSWHWIISGDSRDVYRINNGVEQPASPEYYGRVTLLKEQLRSGWAKLKLSNLRINDSGTYQCLVETAKGADYKTITLSVVAPYKSVTKCIEKIAGGEEVLLTCQSEGYPESPVAWQDGRLQGLKPNTTAVPTANHLFNVTSRIRVSARDKNNYTCNFTNDARYATFRVPDEIPIPQIKNEALYFILSIGAVMIVIIAAVLIYRQRKGSIALSVRNLLGVHPGRPCPSAACPHINTEDEEEKTVFNEYGMEENLGVFLKAHYSDSFSKESSRPWDVVTMEELPPRLENNEGQYMKLQDVLPEAGETLFLEGPPGSGRTHLAQILVSSWTEGRTNLIDLSTLGLLVHVDCSSAEGELFQEVLSQLSLMNKTTADELRTVLTRCSQALLLLDGYREGSRTFDESLKRFLSDRGGCRVLVLASSANCPTLKAACGTGRILRLETQTV